MDEHAPLMPFHTFLWKTSSRCNIDCTYCYVYHSPDDSWRHRPKLMSEEVATAAAVRMREHLAAHGKTSGNIIFHGGEPLMGGIRHLRMLVDVIHRTFAGTGVELTLGMQTNLLLLTEEIAQFLVENHISVGVSLDGPPRINDRYRVDLRGRPTSSRLEQKLELLMRPEYRSIFGGFLCVIDPETDPEEVADYLLSYNPIGIDFLLPLNNHERLPAGKQEDPSAAPYGDWLKRCYDYWLRRPNNSRVRVFQSIINMVCGAPSLVEAIGLNPVDLIVVETDGDLEGVDSLKTTFDGATQLGLNITRDAFDVAASHFAVQSRQLGASSLAPKCQSCRLVGVCGGGYLPHRYSAENGFTNPSVYCEDLTAIIDHIHASVTAAVTPVIAKSNRRARMNDFDSSAGMAAMHAPIVRLAVDTLKEGQTVLDLGCGSGLLARAVALQSGATPFGIEIDSKRAAFARRLLRRYGGDVSEANIFDGEFPWSGRTFDLAMIPVSAFIEADRHLGDSFRSSINSVAKQLLVYVYDDDLDRFGTLAEIAERVGLDLVAVAPDGMASLATVSAVAHA